MIKLKNRIQINSKNSTKSEFFSKCKKGDIIYLETELNEKFKTVKVTNLTSKEIFSERIPAFMLLRTLDKISYTSLD